MECGHDEARRFPGVASAVEGAERLRDDEGVSVQGAQGRLHEDSFTFSNMLKAELKMRPGGYGVFLEAGLLDRTA